RRCALELLQLPLSVRGGRPDALLGSPLGRGAEARRGRYHRGGGPSSSAAGSLSGGIGTFLWHQLPPYLSSRHALFARRVVLFSHGVGDQIHPGVSPPARSCALFAAAHARETPRDIMDADSIYRLSRGEHGLKSQYRGAPYSSAISFSSSTGGRRRVEPGTKTPGMGSRCDWLGANPRRLLVAGISQLPFLFKRTVGWSFKNLSRAHGFERGLGPGSPGREALP